MGREASKQQKTYLTAATLAPILHLAGGVPWYLTIILSLLAAGGRRLLGNLESPWLRRALFWAEAGEAILLLTPCWPGQRDMVWVLSILWLLAVFSCRKGEGCIRDGGLLLWWLGAFLLGSVLFSGTLELKPAKLLKFPAEIPLTKAAALLGVLMLPSGLPGTGKAGAVPEKYLILAPVLLSVLVQGVLGIDRALNTPAPFYEMSRSIRLYGIFDRMEGLSWLGMLLGTYLYFTLVLYGSTVGLEERARKKVLYSIAGFGLLGAFLRFRGPGFLLVSVMIGAVMMDLVLEKIRERKKKKEK